MATKKTEKQNVNLGMGTGRRKTAVARVYLREGEGNITINGRNVDEYFGNPLYVYMVRQPLDVTANVNKFDLVINVTGGGPRSGRCVPPWYCPCFG